MAADEGGGAERRRRLKVYSGNYDGRQEAVMAAHSLKEFQAATGISRDYGGLTGNDEDVAQALSEPGTVFLRRIGAHPGEPYTRMPRPNQDASTRAGEGNRLTGRHVSPALQAPIAEPQEKP